MIPNYACVSRPKAAGASAVSVSRAWPTTWRRSMTPSLSAIMIAKDEERDLPGCLESLKGLVGEIVIVVSDDTTDKTEAIAKAAGAKVIRRKFDDYARQRQASLD